MKKIIPIVYASDENFLIQTYVSIYSILINRKKDYEINFFIFVPNDCSRHNYDSAWEFERYNIEYIQVSKSYFQNVNITLQNITKPTYYRLLIPLFLTYYDKCLYLDGDTICCSDIFELYETNVENNYIAAVRGAIINFESIEIEKRLNIPSAQNYINAGVLVMNLKQMRQDNMVEIFIEHSSKGYLCQDQDVLYKCCYGKIKNLPMKYNVYCSVFSVPREITKQRFEESEIIDAISNPVIVHYPREYSKPWKNINAVEGYRWWDCAESAVSGEILTDLKYSALNYMKQYSYCDLLKSVGQQACIVLFGFSEIGCKLYNQLKKEYPNKIVVFCDNDKSKVGRKDNKYDVLDSKQLKQLHSNSFIIITSQNYSNMIKKQLEQLGFKEDKIAIYRKKTFD